MNDSVPLTVAAIFLAMLAVVWAIETLQQPDPGPQGPVEVFADGSHWTETAPAPRQAIANPDAPALATW